MPRIPQRTKPTQMRQARHSAAAVLSATEISNAIADVYTAADRAALEKSVRTAWSTKYPDDSIAGITFPLAHWEIKKTKQWNDAQRAYLYNDLSILGVRVGVKTGTTIVVYPAYVNKDNVSGAINIGVDTKGDEYVHYEIPANDYK